ncbi:methylenetetrahydrofolate--tRNA-(uracil(54)-C(5))-methyltransferase (FADH(2)-oxidizing) TrmFO [Temperatibacter marinus]|uniref:Methylenetetrahydrofolate--tRNA-(uracil-5-)-methyltransferase TrmFO n=1 Tax=Temperatibacter marinus TaxID=1456591 RepID=A0AA52H8T4_9PROT|nr:methylenetetrahydrofolate--tRNA-(uracil(54)-C(5))-methyltransferase (FADH(2)-oxidizing) TrmFO [Temperatibacter marinus]WND02169.1 methylenetetrahydrofolate--tRNA-(uracil(54)-C(5))-methyltransferase (FADH(2)-oxidizing) TrmFO [Temperatibacter marinus]
MSDIKEIHVVGGGLAGSEAAWQIANQGIPVVLHEMRGVKKTDAHITEGLAELVCSNSFRSDDHENNAVGLLHYEMRALNSLIMDAAERNRIPAGSALAVAREAFSEDVQKSLEDHPLITICREEIEHLPSAEEWDNVIIATGPLTSDALSQSILKATGEDKLAFFDAIAPIIYKETIDFEKAWFQSRYDKGDGKDYINLPLNEAQYDALIADLTDSEKADYKEWEKDTPYFDGCMPVEVMAERGHETLRFGPMKPVGLTNPHSEDQPHAVVQLRQDNALGTLYNIVGFQTKMKWGAQKEVFRKIPGLEKAEFARLGGLHRNTFINSPKLLDATLKLKSKESIRFAGQITGVEGYVESAAMGLLAGRFAAAERNSKTLSIPPIETAFGALMHHITGGADAKTFQPMNINFGLMPDIIGKNPETGRKYKKAERKVAKTVRAKEALMKWLQDNDLTQIH